MDNFKEIVDYLETCYVGARAMNDTELQKRISNALAAFKADTDMDIFTIDFIRWYYDKETKVEI